jgi:D-lactate dehydrogenase
MENIKEFKDTEILSTFIYSDLSSNVLKEMQNLKLICTRATGVDHIDLDYCKKNNIQVANVPDYGKNTVAEQTFGLLLTI